MLILGKLARGASAFAIAGALILSAPVQAADNPQVSAEIMALARAQWASEIAGQPMAQQNASLAEDYTEFNGDFPTLLVGKTMSTRMAALAAALSPSRPRLVVCSKNASAAVRRRSRPSSLTVTIWPSTVS